MKPNWGSLNCKKKKGAESAAIP
jgi:hypothetical protein